MLQFYQKGMFQVSQNLASIQITRIMPLVNKEKRLTIKKAATHNKIGLFLQ